MGIRNPFISIIFIASFVALMTSQLQMARAEAETIAVSGTGIALGIASKLGEQLKTKLPEAEVTVLPSMGSGGGLKALRDGVIDASFSARKLTEAEVAAGMREVSCALTPLVFATTHVNPGNFDQKDLPAIYGSPSWQWPDGTPLKIILRSRSGSENPYLVSMVPGLGEQFEEAFKRPDIAIGTTDQINAGLVKHIEGSVAIMTLLQIKAEKLDLNLVSIDGVEPSAETIRDGRYPFSLRVCLILPQNAKALAMKFAEQMKSPEGQSMVAEMGAAPFD